MNSAQKYLFLVELEHNKEKIMTESQSALNSRYIIDGKDMDATPGQILSAICDGVSPAGDDGYQDIIDESADPLPGNGVFEPSKANEYAALTANAARNSFHLSYCGSLSRLAVARALLEAIFREGSFKLGDLRPDAAWCWDEEPVGGMASFYESVSCACEYLDNLGVRLRSYKYGAGAVNRLDISCNSVAASSAADALFEENPFGSQDAHIGPELRCPDKALRGKGDWLLYIPFDTCNYRLGGSLLSQVTSQDGGKSPDLADADYFIDCYEVVRELIEDGIAIAGRPVADGGLMTAVVKFLGGKALKADVASLMRASGEDDAVKLLFGEIPGVLLQIKDSDFDYVDAELLLQDVAYYPLGQFSGEDGPLENDTSGQTALKRILLSLMDNATEGED